MQEDHSGYSRRDGCTQWQMDHLHCNFSEFREEEVLGDLTGSTGHIRQDAEPGAEGYGNE